MKIDTENPAYSFTSLVAKIAGDEYSPKSVKYGDSMERAMVEGNHPVPLAQTRGVYKPDSGSIELYLADFIVLQKKLGKKFYDTVFQVTVSYAEEGSDTITDTLVGCRFTKREADNSQGNEALTRPLEFQPLYIKWNGEEPFEKMPR
jgi:hypothetical protein